MKKLLFVLLAVFLVIGLILVGCSSPASTPGTSAPVSSTTPAKPPASSTAPASSTTPVKPSTSTAPATSASSPAAKLPEKLVFGTHPVGSAIHAYATILAKVSSEYSGMMTVIQPSSGPVVWVPQLATTGNPQIGIDHTLDAWWAYTGKVSPVPIPGNLLGDKPIYQQAYTNLRIIASPLQMPLGELVRADSPIKTWADIKAKKYRLASGYLSQPSAYATMIVDFINENVTLDNFTPVTVANSNEGVAALQAGRVDIVNSAVNQPVVLQMAATIPVRYLNTSDDPADVKRATSFFPGATYDTWPAGATGLDVPTVLFSAPYVIVTVDTTPDSVVEALLNSWWNHYDELQKTGGLAYTKLTSPDKLMLKQPPIPYAQGAINFFKSKGIWTSAMDDYQQQLLKGVFPFAK